MFWDRFYGVFSLIIWSAAVFGTGVIACRIAGRLEGLICLAVVALAMVALVGFPFAFFDSIPAAYLQLGSIVLSLPLLFVFYVGGLVAYFARRPDML